MDKTEISKKLRFIKEGVHENEYMEVLAICNIYEREIKQLKADKSALSHYKPITLQSMDKPDLERRIEEMRERKFEQSSDIIYTQNHYGDGVYKVQMKRKDPS